MTKKFPKDKQSNWRTLKEVWLNHPRSETWWAMYEAYLNSSDWRLKRGKVIKRDKRCRICGDTERLEVHHPPYTYDDLGEEEISDLITLCHACHVPITSELRSRRYAERFYKPRDVQRTTPSPRKVFDNVVQIPEVQDCRRITPIDAQRPTSKPIE